MTKYLIEIELIPKQELPPNEQEIELLPFLTDHLYYLTKHHDATRWIIVVNRLYTDLDA